MIPRGFKAPAFGCRQHGLLLVLLAMLAFYLALTCAKPASAAASHGQRILSVGPALTEMLYALGLGDRVVGVSSYSNYPPEAKQKPIVGDALHLNDEVALSLRPDLILSVEGEHARLDRLAGLAHARLLILPTSHVKDIWGNLGAIGKATGTEARAATLTRDLQARVARAARGRRPGPAPRVFYMVWNQPLMAAGADSYLNDLIALAGGRNVVAPGTPGGAYPPYSWEALLAADPDVIVGPRNMAQALADLAKHYPTLKAVRAHRVRTLPDDLISRPGPRVPEALAAVVGALR